jgi:hypothetical protein
MKQTTIKTLVLGIAFTVPAFSQSTDQLKTATLNNLRAGIHTSSGEGLPSPQSEQDISDLKDSAYTTVELIKRALQGGATLPTGQKIEHFANATKSIVEKSGQNAYEEASRITLNRANDIVDLTLRILGVNSDLVANYVSGFYVKSLQIAAAYANNPSIIIDQRRSVAPTLTKITTRAQLGIYYSQFLWTHQSNLTSDSSKGVILIKLLDYLFDDLNLDLQRREPILKQTLVDIDDLKKNNLSYRRILWAIDKNQEPNNLDVRQLRGKVETILSNLNQRKNEVSL